MPLLWLGLWLGLAAGGCREGRHQAASADAGADAGGIQLGARAPHQIPTPRPYDDSVRSLRLKRSIVVRAEPRDGARGRGTVAQDTRVAILAWATGKGCKGNWIEIQPGGWVCDRYLEPSKKDPAGVELPRLKPDELVPGVYGKLIEATEVFRGKAEILAKKPARTLAGEVKLRKLGELEVDGKLYWKITSGELVLATRIAALTPTGFAGVELADGEAPAQQALPLAWIVPRGKAKRLGGYALREVVKVFEEKVGRAKVAVFRGTGKERKAGWLNGADLRIARVAPPPPGLLAGERWVDVDTEQQTLVAYEGDKPVFATLVSTGQPKWPTRPGVYRVYVKFAETDMNGQMGDEEPYSVATVPWTQYFAGDLALHTAYWHDRFGEARSHGCVNLSPRDARRLYRWTDPPLLPGYSMANGIVSYPGSIVRIRSGLSSLTEAEPPVQGYAKRVLAARMGASAPAESEEESSQVDRTVVPEGDGHIDAGPKPPP